LDTNIFGDLRTHDKGITPEDAIELRKLIAAGKVIPFSYLNVEEIAAAPSAARVSEGEILLSLVSKNLIIRPHQMLIIEAIRSYGWGGNGRAEAFFEGQSSRE
jgi:hypothetical protein